jgi:prophage endopeptidase
MMFGLPSPWLILGFMLALAGVYGYGHHEGYKQKSTEDAIEIGRKDQKMNEAKEQADEELAKAKTALDVKNRQYVAAVRDGTLRLSIPVSAQAGCAASAAGDGQARAELDGQVSQALIAITNDGDQAIVQLNSCIDRYQQIREIVSGNK